MTQPPADPPGGERVARFTGRVAFVTGGGHGIGAATVRRLCAEGARVVVADLDTPAARAVADELGPDRAAAIGCDLTDAASVGSSLSFAMDHFGRLDALINVAGGSLGAPTPGQTEDEFWQASVELNLIGPSRLVRAAVPLFRASTPVGASRGSIVLVSSVNALAAWGDQAYSAAKAGLSVMAKNLAVDLGPEGIRANVVAPGTVRTRVWDSQGGPDKFAGLYPLGRVGEPTDLAAAIAFLASDDAAWITGVTLPVDGGVTAGRTKEMTALSLAAERDRLS